MNTNLKGRFGAFRAATLLESNQLENRTRGLERARNDGSPESIALLTQREDATLRTDTRLLVELARALAPFASEDLARTKLLALVSNTRAATTGRSEDPNAEIDFLHVTAAMALAAAQDPKSIEELSHVARAAGPGQAAAIHALAAFGISPHAVPVEAPNSPALVRAYAASGDLRLLDALLAATLPALDSLTRAAAIVALAQAGDHRIEATARTLLEDAKVEPKMRIAATEALVLLEAPERFRAVERLIAEPSTAIAGVRLSEYVQDAGIVSALVARIAFNGAREAREDMVTALGHGQTDEAKNALAALLRDATLGPVAAQALAGCSHAGGMAAIGRAHG